MSPSFTGVRYIGLSVRDVRHSAAWYRELLGLEVIRARDPDGIQLEFFCPARGA